MSQLLWLIIVYFCADGDEILFREDTLDKPLHKARLFHRKCTHAYLL